MAAIRSTREMLLVSEMKEVLDRKIKHVIEVEMPAAADLRAIGKAQGRLETLNEMLNLPNAMQAGADADRAEEANRQAITQSQDPRNWRNPHNVAQQ